MHWLCRKGLKLSINKYDINSTPAEMSKWFEIKCSEGSYCGPVKWTLTRKDGSHYSSMHALATCLSSSEEYTLKVNPAIEIHFSWCWIFCIHVIGFPYESPLSHWTVFNYFCFVAQRTSILLKWSSTHFKVSR